MFVEARSFQEQFGPLVVAASRREEDRPEAVARARVVHVARGRSREPRGSVLWGVRPVKSGLRPSQTPANPDNIPEPRRDPGGRPRMLARELAEVDASVERTRAQLAREQHRPATPEPDRKRSERGRSVSLEDKDSLRGSSVNVGALEGRLAWPPRKDDVHKSRSVRSLPNLPPWDSD